jgi:hypothetical protein
MEARAKTAAAQNPADWEGDRSKAAIRGMAAIRIMVRILGILSMGWCSRIVMI